jgi:hypothetical protein
LSDEVAGVVITVLFEHADQERRNEMALLKRVDTSQRLFDKFHVNSHVSTEVLLNGLAVVM